MPGLGVLGFRWCLVFGDGTRQTRKARLILERLGPQLEREPHNEQKRPLTEKSADPLDRPWTLRDPQTLQTPPPPEGVFVANIADRRASLWIRWLAATRGSAPSPATAALKEKPAKISCRCDFCQKVTRCVR